MDWDKHYLLKALIEARKAEPICSPNPAVGAIIVKNNKIIGRGFTQPAGKSHAEVVAINRCKINPENAIMYVTLEPCSHYGKTPPCTDLLILRKIKRVVIGIKDPNSLVNGRGIRKLKQAGIEVKVGLLKDKIIKQMQWYLKYIKTSFPYITLKAGMSIDGKITDYKENSKWISSENARLFSQRLREVNDGIIVGINTIIKDNPHLTYRGEIKKRFYRIILDTYLKIPLNANVLKYRENHKTIIATSSFASVKKVKTLLKKDIEVMIVKTENGLIDLKAFLKKIGEMGIARLIVEGGGTVNYSFLKGNLIDKLMLFIAPKIIGGNKSKNFVDGKGFRLNESIEVKKGRYYNLISDNFIFEGYINYYKG